jgi:hypothetical protein
VDFVHRTPISRYKTVAVLSLLPHLWPRFYSLPSSSPFLLTGAWDEALMAEAMPDWYAILLCGGLAALLGFSVLLCAIILDDRGDAAARVLALRGGGDHED